MLGSGVNLNLFGGGAKFLPLTGRGIKLRPKGPKAEARRAESGGGVPPARGSGGAL